jgi:hypothetical protein
VKCERCGSPRSTRRVDLRQEVEEVVCLACKLVRTSSTSPRRERLLMAHRRARREAGDMLDPETRRKLWRVAEALEAEEERLADD